MPDQKCFTARLEDYAKELGVTFLGVADITVIRSGFLLPEGFKDRYPFALSMGKRLADGVLEELKDAPTPLYLHHYRQTNFFLDRAAFMVSSRIQDLGFEAVPIPASQIIDWAGQRGHVPHKKIGELAGLGWIGRNNLLVHPEFGARFRLVTVLTTIPLEPGAPLSDNCGSCRRCASACPAKAIKERREDFDHLACYEKLKEFRSQGLVAQFICGLCVRACDGSISSRRESRHRS
jgi:epoxyqueuosine reductase